MEVAYRLGKIIPMIATDWSEIVLPRGKIFGCFSVNATSDNPFICG